MKRSIGKLSGILLTASIIVTAVFPMQGTAAVEAGRGIEPGAQMEEKKAAPEGAAKTTFSDDIPQAMETVIPGNIPQTEKMDEHSIMPFSYDINQPVIESFELVENGQTLSRNDTLHFKMSAYDADRDIRYITVQFESYNSYAMSVDFQKSEEIENLYIGTFDCSALAGYEGDFYVSRIYLEDETNNYVEWPVMKDGKYLYTFTFENTKTLEISDVRMDPSRPDGNLRAGDTVTFTAHVVCEGIALESAGLNIKTSDSSHEDTIYMSYDAETQTLTGTYTIKEHTYPSEWYLYSIYAYAGNTYKTFPQNTADFKFTVINDDYDWEKPVIQSITIDKNGQTVKAGESVSVRVKVTEPNPAGSMDIGFRPEAPETFTLYHTLYWDNSAMEYTGTIYITEDSYPTKWELAYLSVSDTYGNAASLSDFREDWETARPWYYTVDPQGYVDDQKAPVIESITINKNGQWVYPGDTLTLTVKVDEENPYFVAYAYFYPQASYVSGSHVVDLYYNADSREYVGTIYITNDTYPCEWMLTDLNVFDTKGHYAYLSDFKPDWYETCPWYYRVETDGTYREDVKDAAFSVYGLVRQEDGSYAYGPVVENKTIKVGRRDSLEGLGICPPLPAEGVNVKFKEENSGMEINADTELFFGNTPNPSYDFRAVYDKSCVNVVLNYISKDKGATTAVVPQFVDKDATYGEMLASFVPPADADLELLAGYQLDGALDETAQVEDRSYAVIDARYNNCLVAWNTIYLDENGNKVSKIVTREYEKNTPVHAALATLEAPAAPDGMEFEKWALPGISGNETLFHEMTNLNVAAIYRGKTTADVSYTYRDENGKLVSGSRLMALDGELLSYQAALEEVKEALKELNHLNGLVLSDWTAITSGTDIAGYKKMNIKAQYANCVVILKYPKDVCEYVVAEKDSLFTLPVQNDTYTDILWEGYGQGQTVTITGDCEFLVADAKLKDGTEEEPSGGKLPADEINKIISDLQQSEPGETVQIDMGKATVVPKEILEDIRGKDVSIVLDMGDYSWSISGNDVAATDLKDIDLEVIVDTDGIPPALVESLADGNPATQITLRHDGEFGFRADLTVNLGAEHSGSTGNLYYFDSSGKLIFRDAGTVGADGNISLSFSHASEYVVIFEKPDTPDPDEEKKPDSPDPDVEKKPDTPDSDGKKEPASSGSGEKKEPAPSGSDAKKEPVSSGSDEKKSTVSVNPAVKKDNNSGIRKSPKTGE